MNIIIWSKNILFKNYQNVLLYTLMQIENNSYKQNNEILYFKKKNHIKNRNELKFE